MKGRKPKEESREAEIRVRLAECEQVPESSRRSLRALARDLGTSHQLLGHCCNFFTPAAIEPVSWELP